MNTARMRVSEAEPTVATAKITISMEVNFVKIFLISVIAGIILFGIIVYAVKLGVKEAYLEIKEDLLKELNSCSKTASEDNSIN